MGGKGADSRSSQSTLAAFDGYKWRNTTSCTARGAELEFWLIAVSYYTKLRDWIMPELQVCRCKSYTTRITSTVNRGAQIKTTRFAD